MNNYKNILLIGLITFCCLNEDIIYASNSPNKDSSLINLNEKNYSTKLESFLKDNSILNIKKVEKIGNAYVVTIEGVDENKTIPEGYVDSYFHDRNSKTAADSILEIISDTGPK